MPANLYTEALIGPSWLTTGHDNNVTYVFANDFGRPWTSAETAMFAGIFASIEAVCNINFVLDAASPEIVANLISTSQMLSFTGLAAVGWYDHVPTSTTYFAQNDPRWVLAPGALGHWVAAHEVLHWIGLGHPDLVDFGETGTGVFPGVTPGDRQDTGDNGLNATWNTLQSAYFGGAPTGYGRAAGPMAFDIAALQELYGARANATGNDTYSIPTTYWQCIWDTDGVDTIAGTAANDVINLNAATLQNEFAGGGMLSYRVPSSGIIPGGLSIANGVEIENITGGGGNDTLTGNALGNYITGGSGTDKLVGNAGADILSGGGAADTFWLGNDADVDRALAGNLDIIREFDSGEDRIDLVAHNATGISIIASGSAWLVRLNLDADAVWERSITVIGSKPILSDIDW